MKFDSPFIKNNNLPANLSLVLTSKQNQWLVGTISIQLPKEQSSIN